MFVREWKWRITPPESHQVERTWSQFYYFNSGQVWLFDILEWYDWYDCFNSNGMNEHIYNTYLKQTWSQNWAVCSPNVCLALLCKTYWCPLLLIKKKKKVFLRNLPSKYNNLPLPMMIFSADSLTAPIIWLYSMWHTLSQ